MTNESMIKICNYKNSITITECATILQVVQQLIRTKWSEALARRLKNIITSASN